MGSLPTSILLLVFMIGYCAPQNDDDILLVTLEAIAKTQKTIVQRFDDLQMEMSMMKESLATVEENVNHLQTDTSMIKAQVDEVQQCATRDQVDAFKNTFIAEQEMVRRTSQHCFTRDEMITFQDFFETDECAEGSHNCSEFATCSNSVFHYKCYCNPGYSGDGFTCQDINECMQKPDMCGDSQLCINHPGNYSCTCPTGFQKEGNTCQDINECIQKPDMCGDSQLCINHHGNYSCTCPTGFQKEGNTCQDINECKSTGHMCNRYATCINTKGNYTCECLPYYDGDGYTCNVSKCASPSKVISDLGCVIPVPMAMTWDEAQVNCLRAGGRLLEGLRREHLEPLAQHFVEYLKRPYAQIGVRGGLYVKSRHPVSSQDNLWGEGNPNGSDQDKSDCGQVYLSETSTFLIDYYCSNKVPSLCQILY